MSLTIENPNGMSLFSQYFAEFAQKYPSAELSAFLVAMNNTEVLHHDSPQIKNPKLARILHQIQALYTNNRPALNDLEKVTSGIIRGISLQNESVAQRTQARNSRPSSTRS